jgi:hypothetical protein
MDARLDFALPLPPGLDELLGELADAQDDGADEGGGVDEVEREGVGVQVAHGPAGAAHAAHDEGVALGVAREGVAHAGAAVGEQTLAVRYAPLDLDRVRGMVRDEHAARLLLVPAEGGDVVVVAVEDAGLAGRVL